MLYFDYNATSPVLPEAALARNSAEAEHWYNPSSPYRAAARVRNALENARCVFADILGGIPPQRVVFTSGATEANNGILSGLSRVLEADALLSVSPVEHPCVRVPARTWWAGRLEWLPVDVNGRVDCDAAVAGWRKRKPALVSMQAANNETGVLQPWREMAEACRKEGILFHCDAAQWIGKLPLDGLAECDLLTFSGHKFGAPKGVGLVLCPDPASGITVKLQLGGDQEFGMRSGTEDYPAVAAMLAALQSAQEKMENDAIRERDALRKDFIDWLENRWGNGVIIHGKDVPCLWNTVSVSMPHSASHRWIHRLDRKGIIVSSGSACAAGKEGPSEVLAAMGVSAEVAARTLRFSAGWQITRADWQQLLAALSEVDDELRGEAGSGSVIQL